MFIKIDNDTVKEEFNTDNGVIIRYYHLSKLKSDLEAINQQIQSKENEINNALELPIDPNFKQIILSNLEGELSLLYDQKQQLEYLVNLVGGIIDGNNE